MDEAAESGDLTASLQCGPVRYVQHDVDTRGVSISAISAKHKAGCSSLHCFSYVDVPMSVEVPDGSGILQRRPDNGFVGPFFDAGVADLQVPSKRIPASCWLCCRCYLYAGPS